MANFLNVGYRSIMREIKHIIITMYDKRSKIVEPTKKNDSVFIENIECTSEINLRKLIINAGLCKIVEKNSVLTLTRPLILSNIKCKTLSIQSIDLSDTNAYLKIQDSSIDSLWIHSCKFRSLKIEKSFIPELTIIDSNVHENVNFDFSEIPETSPVKISIDDTVFRGNLIISNLKMIDIASEFVTSGDKSVIHGDFTLQNIYLIKGKIDLSGDFKQNCIFRRINSIVDKNRKQLMPNVGELAINGGEIVKDIVLEDCHLDSLSIANTPVGGTREYEFTFNRLKGNTAILLRDGALKKNNLLLAEKYTAEVFDAYLKENAVTSYKNWANYLEHYKKGRITLRRILYNLIWEPIVLLIPSITSSEGILLWFNKYSNNYNRSWLRGVFFTMIIALLFYFILNFTGMEQPYFVFDIHFNGFGEVVKGYLSLIDVFNLTGIGDTLSFELTSWGYAILFISKIFIAYGIWQTIYAFYRYRK